MGREEFEMKLRKLIHSVKALSPIFATLILIAIAVIAGVVVYMFTSGYIATMTGGGTAGQEKIAIQSVSADTTGTVTVLLQSISGNPVVQNIIVKDSSGNQVAVVTANAPNPAPNPGPGLSTGTLYSISGASTVGLTAGNSYTVTVVTRAGNNFVSPTFTTSTSTSGGATPTPTPSPSPTPSTSPTPTPSPVVVTRTGNVGFRDVTLTGTGVGSATFTTTPTAGNLLVVIAAHRQGDPTTYHAPTMTGYTLRAVEYYSAGAGDIYQRRVIAVFTRIATGTAADNPSINWNDNVGGFQAGSMILQEFSGATSYNYLASGGASSGSNQVTTLTIPQTALNAGSNNNILAIGGLVSRDDPPATTGFSYNNLGGLITGTPSLSLAYTASGWAMTNTGAAVTQTTATWTNAHMVSGLLVLFTFS
jgi:flagellin-like protein